MTENKDRPGAEPPASVEPTNGEGGLPVPDGASGGAESGSTMNGADFQRYIGRGLRAVFDDVASQPVPDRFLELMKKLG